MWGTRVVLEKTATLVQESSERRKWATVRADLRLGSVRGIERAQKATGAPFKGTRKKGNKRVKVEQVKIRT